MTRYDIGVELQWYNSAALWYNGAMAQWSHSDWWIAVMEVAVATSTYVFQVISADSGFLLKIGASIMVTGRDVYGLVVGRWLCNDNWMRLTVTPKGGVKMLHSMLGGITVSCQWLLHGFTRIWYLQQYRYAMWMVLLLLQQVSPMDDVFLVSFSCFRGHGEENRCF